MMKSSVNEGSWREWDTGGKVGYRRSRVCGVVDSKPRCEDGEGGVRNNESESHEVHAQYEARSTNYSIRYSVLGVYSAC